jgi:hypothetical protein
VAHTCNPRYTGGRYREDCSLRPARPKSQQDAISMRKLGVTVCVPIIPATQEAEVGGPRYRSAPGKNVRPYLKNK